MNMYNPLKHIMNKILVSWMYWENHLADKLTSYLNSLIKFGWPLASFAENINNNECELFSVTEHTAESGICLETSQPSTRLSPATN